MGVMSRTIHEVLEALKILEDATLDCKKRNIDTPEVREAIDVIEPYCSPQWRIEGFRDGLRPSMGQFGFDVEGQQQVLRVYFTGIHGSIRTLLHAQLVKLVCRYARSTDAGVKTEIDWLTAELAKIPARWEFYVR